MKIGVMTYFSSHNYGAFLQAYALTKTLSGIEGVEAELVNYTLAMAEEKNLELMHRGGPEAAAFNKARYECFENAIYTLQPLSRERLVSDSIEEFNAFAARQHYDLIVAGSDEIWKMVGYRGFPNAYWLPDPDAPYEKMSYAASSRTPLEKIDETMKEEVRAFLKDFTYIGVRDRKTWDVLTEIYGHREKFHMNADPTFLYDFGIDRENGRRLLREKYGVSGKKKVVALMLEKPEHAEYILNTYGDRYDFVILYQYQKGAISDFMPTPFEWADIIAASDAMVSTFFHGTVFAIKGGTPFISLEWRHVANKEASKTYDLLSRVGLPERFGLLNEPGFELEPFVDAFLQDLPDRASFREKAMAASEAEKALGQSFLDLIREKSAEKN